MKRIDERDIMFARMGYQPGSKEYEDYYHRSPEKREFDELIRQLPQLCSEGTTHYHEENSLIAEANFQFLGDICHLAEGPVNSKQVPVQVEEITRKLKGLAAYNGAALVGVVKMQPEHYYSHRGRRSEHYGEQIEEFQQYGIVFAVEMDADMIDRAPQVAEVIETSKGYVKAAIIGMQLAYYIRSLGYPARNHMDGNYLVVAPLVARDAGLGDIGRLGILITREYGPRIRLGVVTTDMPLVADEATNFTVQKFCYACGKCVHTCPAGAIPSGPKEDIQGTKRWQIKQELCYRHWRFLGTDCGICLSTCPLSRQIKPEMLDNIDKPEGIKQLLAEHEAQYGIRPYQKDPVDWLK